MHVEGIGEYSEGSVCFSQNKLDPRAVVQYDQLQWLKTEEFPSLKSDSEMRFWPPLMTEWD